MADSISLSGSSSVNVGSSITITATGEFGSGYNSYRLYARTANSKASVSPTYRTGYSSKDDFTTTFSVTGSAAGSETLYVYIQGSTNGTTWSNVTYATKSITVSGGKSDQTWTLSNGTVYVGSTLGGSGLINGATYGTLTYSSSSTSKFTVNSSGTITGVSSGSATLTVTAAGNSSYNSRTQTCTITVSKNTPTWALSPSTVRGWTGETKTITISSYSTYSSLTWSISGSSLDSYSRSGAYVYLSKNSAGLGTVTVSTASNTTYNSRSRNGSGYFYGKPTTRTGLVYTGSAQQLLSSNATYSSSQTFYYAVTTSSSMPLSGYSSGYASATGTGSSSSDTTYYVHVSTSNGSSGYIGYVTVTITGKSKATWTTQPTSNNSTYNGNYKEISTEGTTSQGTVKYRSRPSGGTWGVYSEDIPTARDAGTYNIEAYIVGDSTHQDSDHVTFNTVISQYQLDASITLASTMTYNTSARNLVSSGSVINPGITTGKGTLYYALGSNGTTAPTSGWSTSIPTGTNAGTYYVWYKVDTADSTNCLSKSATYKGSVTINQKSITITAPTINTATLTYTATDKTLASNGSVSDTTGATFKIGLGSSGSSAPTTWHSSDAITAVNAGTYYVWYKAVLNDSTNYTVDTSNHYLGSKAIGKAALTVTGSSHTVTYGDATPTVSVSYSGFKGSDTAAGVFSTLPTASTTYTSTTSVSSSPVAVTVTAGSTPTNYSVTYVNGAITINKKAPTITWIKKPTSVGYGQTTTDALQASADSGGTISFEIDDTTIATLNADNTITGVKVGSTAVYVYVAATTNYLNGSTSYSFDVTKVAPTYTAPTNATPTYSGSAQYICTTGSCTGGTISYYASTSSSSATGGSWSTTRPTLTSCGINRYVWWKITGDSNHTDKDPAYVGSVSYIAKKFLTVTASSHTVTYGDAKPTLSVSYSGFVTGESASNLTTAPTASTTYTSSTPVSSSPVPTTADGGVADNYSFIYQDGSITINKANSSGTAPTYVRPVYNGTDQYICSSATNVVGGTAQYYASTSSSSATGGSWSSSRPTLKNCGTTRYVWWKIVGDANHNDKAAAYIGTSSYIQQKTLTVTCSSHSVTYGDTKPTLTNSYSGFITGEDTSNLTTIPVPSTAYTPTTGVSSSPVATIPNGTTSGSATNYTFSYVNGSITIAKATLTVTCSSHSVTYGDAKPTLSNSYSGWKNGEGISALTVIPTPSTTYTSSTPVSSSPVSTVPNGAIDGVAANYTFNYVNGSITIGKKTVTLSWGTHTWTYDGTEKTVTCSVDSSSIISGDTCTITGINNNKRTNAGTQTVTVTTLSNNNYKLPSDPTTTLTINKFNLSATVTLSSTMTYNGSERNLASGTVVNPGSTTGKGTLKFALGANGTTAPSSGWVTDNPIKRTNAGTYYIWYKVDAVDTTNCNSLAATYKGTVTINKASVTITITSPVSVSWTGTSGNTTSYTRNSNSSVTFSASTNFGTIAYASSDSSVATINSSGVLTCAYWGGSCTLTISVAGTSNYNGASGTVSLTTLNVSNTKIYVNGQWKTVTPYIYTADGWKRCVAVIYTADGWKKC